MRLPPIPIPTSFPILKYLEFAADRARRRSSPAAVSTKASNRWPAAYPLCPNRVQLSRQIEDRKLLKINAVVLSESQ